MIKNDWTVLYLKKNTLFIECLAREAKTFMEVVTASFFSVMILNIDPGINRDSNSYMGIYRKKQSAKQSGFLKLLSQE